MAVQSGGGTGGAPREEPVVQPVSRGGGGLTANDPVSGRGGGSGLIVPVAGVNTGQLTDTHGAPRSGGRSHAGIDIFAPKGTPVIAASGGTVIKAVRTNTGLGGLRVTVKGDDGRIYYYAHMSGVDVNQGDRITAGQRLGAVGDSGNAAGTPPHLHFSIGKNAPDDGGFNAFSELTGAQSVPVDQIPQGGQVMAASTDGITPAAESMNVGGLSVPQVPDAIAQLGDDELRDYLEENYGYLAWALSIPEVGDILLDVARGDVTDPDKLFGQLFETEWWQNTSASVRQWDALANQDPATAMEQVQATSEAVRLYAARLGLVLDESRIEQMSRDALRFGWVQPGQAVESSSQLRNALFAESRRATVEPEEAKAGDDAALAEGYDATYRRVKQAFANRKVPIASDAESEEERLDRITRDLMEGRRSWESLRASLDAQRPLQPGTLTATADTLRAMASDFLVPLSDHAARDWSERIAKGETTEAAFRSYLQQQASSLFSGNAAIAQALESGMTVRQWADPYVQMAAQMLEVSPTDIDLNDQRFMQALHQVDPESGGGTPMGLGDFQRYVRGLPEWDSTQNAVDRASAAVEFLGQRMGAA